MPIDLSNGHVVIYRKSIDVPGRINLAWEMKYSSERRMLDTGVSRQWRSYEDIALSRDKDELTYIDLDGAEIRFRVSREKLEDGFRYRDAGACIEIYKQGDEFVVQSWSHESNIIIRFIFPYFESGRAKIVAISNVTGDRLDFLRDGNGLLRFIKQIAEDRHLKFTYDSRGRIIKIHLGNSDGEVEVEAYSYSDSGQLNAITDSIGLSDRMEYDAIGRVSRELTKNGGVYTYQYDELGRCVKYSGADRYDQKTIRYLASGITEVMNSHGRAKSYQFNESGQVLSEWNEYGGQTKREYDDLGRIIRFVDPLNSQVCFEYDEKGNCVGVIDPRGSKTQLNFNVDHLLTLQIDALGGEWRRVYDMENRLLKTIGPDGASFELSYDASGNLVEIRSPTGGVKRFTYEKSVPLSVSDFAGGVSYMKFNVFGLLVQKTNAIGGATRYRYDAGQNLVAISFENGTQIAVQYDSYGNATKIFWADGTTSSYEYGPCSRLLESIDPLGRKVRYLWDTEPGRLSSVVNEKGETFRFQYDEAGNCSSEVGFDGKIVEYQRNLAGSCICKRTSNGQNILFAYDECGRTIGIKSPSDGTAIKYEFDAMGRLEKGVNGSCETILARDSYGRIIEERRVTDDSEHWVKYERDPAGNLLRIETDIGFGIKYELNGNGQWKSLETNSGKMQFAYDLSGNEVERKIGLHSMLQMSYDKSGRITGQTITRQSSSVSNNRLHGKANSGDVVFDRKFSYSVSGNLTAVADFEESTSRYEYDPSQRLIGYFSKVLSERYSFDDCDNVLTIRSDLRDEVRSSNRRIEMGSCVAKVDDVAFSHDADGRLISRTEIKDGVSRNRFLVWNSIDQLMSIQLEDGTKWEYEYDAFGRRICKKSDDMQLNFVWSGDLLLYETNTTSNTWLGWCFEQDSFKPIAKCSAKDFDAIITSPSGLPTHVLTSNGDLIEDKFQSPFGDSVSGSSEVICSFRMPGHYEDVESGMTYTRFRYYSPETCGFVSKDPIGLNGGLNLHSYTPDPINEIDPFGLSTSTDSAKLGKNLVNAGESPRPNGSQDAHHIIMSNSTDPRMEQLRKVMNAHGVDINDPRNGVWLPRNSGEVSSPSDSRTLHKGDGLHGEAYKQHVYDTIMGPDGKTPTKRQLLARLRTLKSELEKGKTFKKCG